MAIGKPFSLLSIAIFSILLAISLSKPKKIAISATTIISASPANFPDLPPDITPFLPTPRAQNHPPSSLQPPAVVGDHAFAPGPSFEGLVEKTSAGSATLPAAGNALFIPLAFAAFLYGPVLF
ncbi:hypothetical protein ACLOJK_019276 [Asimina triloba]